jgi:ABC-type molybdenum transport system ATPase subunit/photorepair protein PhrA
LVHAALDLGRPALMVVDEPAQGLDADELVELVKLIHRRAERGRAYLVISHRQELAVSVHRHLELAEGRLREASRA